MSNLDALVNRDAVSGVCCRDGCDDVDSVVARSCENIEDHQVLSGVVGVPFNQCIDVHLDGFSIGVGQCVVDVIPIPFQFAEVGTG